MTTEEISLQREAIEATYDGVCSVFTSSKVKVNGETKLEWLPLIENQICAFSQNKLTTVTQTETKGEISYTAKLFIAPEVSIPPGSKIIVEQYGGIYNLKQTGKPFKYPTHQEILIVEEENA